MLAGIASDRNPGLSFTGHFLDTNWPHIGRDDARIVTPFGAHCDDGHGRMELTAALMTLDMGLGTATRLFIQPGERIATAQLYAQFTGAPLEGDFEVASRFAGLTQGDAVGQMLSSATATMNGRVVCHGNAAFVRLPPPPGTRTMAPLPWQSAARADVPRLAAADLDEREARILARCDTMLEQGSANFLRRFWDIIPEADDDGATCLVTLGPHMANRVGHVQGGILLGLAAHTAMAAAPRHAVLSNLSAWFISPGRGATLTCRSASIHAGRSFAVVKSEIVGADGARVLEMVTAHAAGAA